MYRKQKIETLIATVFLAILTLTVGCARKPRGVVEEPPPVAPISPAPLEELTVPQVQEEIPSKLATESAGKLYSLSVRQGELKDVLLAFARESGENLVVDPEVAGTVTVDLNQVTLEQALDAILTPLGYAYRKQGRFIRISRPLMETRLFTLNYLNTKREAAKTISAAQGTAGQGGRLSGSESRIAGGDLLDPWMEIQEGLTAMIFGEEPPEAVVKAREKGVVSSLTSKDGKKLVISRMTGVVLVRDYLSKLQEVARFLERIEGSAQRQVLIEARLLEVQLNNEFRTGIRWDNIQQKLLNLDISTFELSWNLDSNSTSGSGVLGITGAPSPLGAEFVLADLVEALETQGEVNSLASPRVATLNNQAAIIKIANQDVYFTSEISQTQDSTLQSFTPNVVDIGVILDVTPQISPDDSIIMNIHPSFSEKIADVETPDGITTFPLLSVRETDTVVKVRDGQTIIIAGLIADRKTKTRTGLPCLMDLPLVGDLFKFREEISRKSELVILLTPTVLAGRRIDEASAEELRRLDALKQEFYQQ